jgi:hypothetical protein
MWYLLGYETGRRWRSGNAVRKGRDTSQERTTDLVVDLKMTIFRPDHTVLGIRHAAGVLPNRSIRRMGRYLKGGWTNVVYGWEGIIEFPSKLPETVGIHVWATSGKDTRRWTNGRASRVLHYRGTRQCHGGQHGRDTCHKTESQ